MTKSTFQDESVSGLCWFGYSSFWIWSLGRQGETRRLVSCRFSSFNKDVVGVIKRGRDEGLDLITTSWGKSWECCVSLKKKTTWELIWPLFWMEFGLSFWRVKQHQNRGQTGSRESSLQHSSWTVGRLLPPEKKRYIPFCVGKRPTYCLAFGKTCSNRTIIPWFIGWFCRDWDKGFSCLSLPFLYDGRR